MPMRNINYSKNISFIQFGVENLVVITSIKEQKIRYNLPSRGETKSQGKKTQEEILKKKDRISSTNR